MGKEAIIERLMADAEREAGAIVAEAQKEAESRAAEARAAADRLKAETAEEIRGRAKRIAAGKSAAARLEASKILLAEKRRAIGEIYARALKELLSLGEHDSLALVSRLLAENAEEGDEVIFSSDYPFAAKAAKLPVVGEKHLRVSERPGGTGGGFTLCGKTCDKDVTFAALLAADRAEREPALAAKLFGNA